MLLFVINFVKFSRKMAKFFVNNNRFLLDFQINSVWLAQNNLKILGQLDQS